MRILGVDPGSRLTGYGCIDGIGNQLRHVTHGTLQLIQKGGKDLLPLEDRLLNLYEGLSAVIEQFRPEVMVVEKVFFAKNAVSALKLGQARGAVLLTGKIYSLKIFEYSPTEVKQVVAGYGQADKSQVAKMVQTLTGQRSFTTYDASDGLALAICHLYCSRILIQSASSHSSALQSFSTQSRSKRRLSMAESLGIKIPKKV